MPQVNYTLKANIEKVSDIGDTIQVIDERLGITLMTNLIAYDYDCILDQYTELEFGNFQPTLSGLMGNITQNTENMIQENNDALTVTLGQELQQAQEKIWRYLCLRVIVVLVVFWLVYYILYWVLFLWRLLMN